MNNIGLIIANEYKTRVLKKSFLILTFLTPILMLLFMALPTWLMTRTDDTKKTIVIIDKSGLYGDVFQNDDIYTYLYLDSEIGEARKTKEGVYGFLYITSDLSEENVPEVKFYSEKQPNSETLNHLRQLLNRRVEQQKIDSYNIPELKQIIRDTHSDVQITAVKFSEDGQEQFTSAELAEIMAMLSALLIYMFIIMYGSMVMQSVVQEKSNRIMEVMVASTRPFDLMMGKIIAVALVGLTQFFLWVMLLGIGGLLLMPLLISHLGMQADMADAMQQMETLRQSGAIGEVLLALQGFDFGRVILLFIIYFLGGYLLYASLFAACGSVVDNETDTQQFSMPITTLMMFAMFAGLYAAQHPDTSFTWWCSMIPFTSPVVMLVRLPFDVAWWELLLSLLILLASFILTTYLAAKIYRVGILMYGKKPTWHEVMKWIRY